MEKLRQPDLVVGKFGVGLKDALATFDRHGIELSIRSAHGDIATASRAKHGFDDVITLHAIISEPADPSRSGGESPRGNRDQRQFLAHGARVPE